MPGTKTIRVGGKLETIPSDWGDSQIELWIRSGKKPIEGITPAAPEKQIGMLETAARSVLPTPENLRGAMLGAGKAVGLQGENPVSGALKGMAQSEIEKYKDPMFWINPAGYMLSQAGSAITGGLVESGQTIKQGIQERSPEMVAQGTTQLATTAATVAGMKGATAKIPKVEPINALELQKAIKPGVRGTSDFSSIVGKAEPILREAEKVVGNITDFESLGKALGWSRDVLINKFKSVLGPNAAKTVNGSAVADTMESTITKRFEQQNPSAAQGIRKKADYYRKDMSIEDLDNARREVNAELETYYSKFPKARHNAEMNPEIAHLVKEGEAIRQLEYDYLSKATGQDAASINQQLGAVWKLEDVYQRAVIRENQASGGLAGKFAKVYAAGQAIRGIGRGVGGDLAGGATDIAQGASTLAGSSFEKFIDSSNMRIREAFRQTGKDAALARRSLGALLLGTESDKPQSGASILEILKHKYGLGGQ